MILKKSLLGLAAIAALAIGSAAVATPAFAYKALAMTDYGSGWGFARNYPTPNKAIIQATSACERQAGSGACRTTQTWEDNDWYFVGISCDNGTYTAASPQGYGRAEYLAYNKADIAGDGGCWTVVEKY
jgi:hypothetical protein